MQLFIKIDDFVASWTKNTHALACFNKQLLNYVFINFGY